MNLTNVIQEFGARHGQPGASLAAGASTQVSVDGITLSFQASDTELLAVTVFAAPFLEPARLLAMLQSLDARRLRPDGIPIQLASKGSASELKLVAALRWPAATVSAAQIDQGAGALHRFRKEWLS